jgi:hypothetical protein
MAVDTRITATTGSWRKSRRLTRFDLISGEMGILDGVSMLCEHSRSPPLPNECPLTGQDDMDDLDHVLNHLRQEYSYRIWALVGHSRGSPHPPKLLDGSDLPNRGQRSISVCCSSRPLDSFDRQLFRTVYVGASTVADRAVLPRRTAGRVVR